MKPGVRQFLVVLALAAAGCSPAGGPGDSPLDAGPRPEPWFEDVSTSSGLDFVHRSGHRERHLFPEIIGGGVALFDMDGDGDLDAYLVQSGSLEEPGGAGGANRLFANRGDGTFEDITAGSGADDRGYGMGVAAGDYDNDGDVDLYVTNFGPNVLLRNEGDGRFSDRSTEAGVDEPSWGTSTAFLDYDADGDLDLFVANYVNWSIGIEQDCYNPAGLLDYCLPTNYGAPALDRLFRNDGDGTFTDVSVDVGLQTAFGNGLGVVAGDFDGDGRVDVFVANDTMMNQLWLNLGDEGFRDESLLRGCALDEHGLAKAGMGVAAEDYDADGDLDLMVVNLEGQTDSFFLNEAGFFVDHTGRAGLGATSRKYTRFGIGLIDFDNDGTLDLYEANGRVIRSPEADTADAYAEPNMLFRGDGRGGFAEIEPLGGTAQPLVATGRAAAFGDLDGDGGVDVVVLNRDGPVHVLRNVHAARGNWLGLRVVDEHGRDALGAQVTMTVGGRKLSRGVRAAYGYCASSDPRVHVGLGAATAAENVTVRWPDGTTRSFGTLKANQIVELK